MDKAKTKKIRITPERAKQIALRDKKEMDDFYAQHFLRAHKDSSDLLFTIKNHLYIENLIDETLISIFPKTNEILKLSFFQKLNLFEALNLSPSPQLLDVLKLINRLRNKFAHNINYKISKKDIAPIVTLLKLPRARLGRVQLRTIFQYVIGYLHCLRTLCRIFPMGMFLMSLSSTLKKDKCCTKSMFQKIYPWDLVIEIIENMKL